MEAVKVPSTSQVKSQMRTVSADASKGGDEFKKLLQVKNDQVQKEPVKKEQTQPQNADVKKKGSENSGEQVKDTAEGKKDHIQDTEEEILVPGASEEQDALLQAAMQQTLAQMAGIVVQPQPPKQEQAGEPAEITADSGVLLSEEPLLQNISLQTEPVQNADVSGAAVQQNVSAETVSKENQVQPESAVVQPQEEVRKPEQPKESKASTDGEAAQDSEYSFKGFEGFQGSKASDSEPEVQVSESRPAVTGAEQKVQIQEKTDAQESLFGAAPVKNGGEQAEHIFSDQRTETVPMKTSQDTLPQDLGRTLAAKLPGGGRELVMELEPANLGKLTIKMVYEAGRAAVSIIATNPKTLEILNQKAAEIANILEEKTGQETIIYTQEAQQESQEENPEENHQGGQGQQQGQEEKRQARKDGHGDAESFAQQLRLGLV